MDHAEHKCQDKDPAKNARLDHEAALARALRVPDAEVSADHSTEDAEKARQIIEEAQTTSGDDEDDTTGE